MQKGYPPRSAPYKSAEHVKSLTTAKDDVDRERVADKPYLAAVASCLWVYSILRADISYVLNGLCSVMHDPSMDAWEAVVDLISYLYQSRELTITFHADSKKNGHSQAQPTSTQWELPGCAACNVGWMHLGRIRA